MKKVEKILIGQDKTYLSEAITKLPSNCIFDKGKVGCGGTSVAIESDRPYVIAVPFKSLIVNKLKQYPNDRYSGKLFGVDGDTLKKDVKDYLKSVDVPKFIVTYDSLEKLSKWINPSEYNLLIDEMHLLFTQYSFRKDAAMSVLNNYTSYKEFCFMTATVLEEEFILDELVDIDIVVAEWEVVKEVKVESVKCITNVKSTVVQLINEFLSGKIDGNAYFFVNSVEFIKEMVDACNLTDDNTRAIWSINNKKEVGVSRGETIDSPKKINLLTSTVFEGSDLYDEDGYIFIISDSTKSHTLIDISTSFQQIAGRIRNTKNWETIYHIYTGTRYDVDITFEEFKRSTDIIIRDTMSMLNKFNTLFTETERCRFLKMFSENSEYMTKRDNTLIFDSNKVKIDLYNFKITKCLYKLRINIAEEYKKNGFKVSEYEHSALDITRMDSVDSKNFKEIVDELENLPLLSLEATEVYKAAYTKYPFLKEALNKLGFDGIKSLGYVITSIKQALLRKSDIGLENKIIKLLAIKINTSAGSFHTSATLKSTFESIYKELGIQKKAKGTDINNYFETKSTSRRNKDKESEAGVVIIRSKTFFKN